MSSAKASILRDLTLGERIAEDEVAGLEHYFVETDSWRRILAGDVDVVYGAKGAGKSALYLVLLAHSKVLQDRKIAVIKAENQVGNPVFQDLVADPPTSENEFRFLWKLYFLSIIGNRLSREKQRDARIVEVINHLQSCDLLDQNNRGLKGILRNVRDYVRVRRVEGEAAMNPATGELRAGGSITFGEPSRVEYDRGSRSVDALLAGLDACFAEQELQVWLALDRLDVAFTSSRELETNALRALFRVYNDLKSCPTISPKIFIRTDIWRRITKEGFPEASHITRTVNLSWNKEALKHLVVRRLVQNQSIREYVSVDQDLLGDVTRQDQLLSELLPERIERGDRRSLTFDWLLSRTRDGTGTNAPRELIHLLTAAKQAQLEALERGEPDPEAKILIDRSAFGEGLKAVSRFRLENTLFAEYPDLKVYMEKLEGEKTEHNWASLAALWDENEGRTREIAQRLVDVGLFEARGSKDQPIFWVPFLYRDGLNLVRGKDAALSEEDPPTEAA